MADGPLTNLANLKGRTDSNGYLLVTIAGGAISPDKISLNNASKDIVFWRQAAKTLEIDSDGAGALLTLIKLIGPVEVGGASQPAAGGSLRLGNNNGVNWRNAGNTADVSLFVNASDAFALQAKIGSYNNITTTANGVPSIYGSGAVSATTGAIASLATYTVGASNAEFEIAGHVDVTTATTHAFTMVANYTDPAGTTRAQTLSFMLVAGGALVTVVTAASGTVPYNGVPQRIRCKATTAITILTTGTLTTVTYDANASIIQVN